MPSSGTSTRSPRPLALRTGRDESVRAGSGRCCTSRHNPELHCQVRPATTIYSCYASSLDTARIDEIVLSTVCSSLSLTSTATVSDNCRCGTRLVLQLDRIVVESGLLVVELDVAILVKLGRRQDRRLHRSCTRSGSRTSWIETSELDRCSYALASRSGGINRD